jgi:hypothetical protein
VYGGDPVTSLDDASGERRWSLDVGTPHRLAAAGSTLYVATANQLVALRE